MYCCRCQREGLREPKLTQSQGKGCDQGDLLTAAGAQVVYECVCVCVCVCVSKSGEGL